MQKRLLVLLIAASFALAGCGGGGGGGSTATTSSTGTGAAPGGSSSGGSSSGGTSTGGTSGGTSSSGGSSSGGSSSGGSSSGGSPSETVLYSFNGATDGSEPRASLIMDKSGNLYGTMSGAGPSNKGTAFEFSSSGAFSVLHAFAGGADGANPEAPLVFDSSGNLYGTTRSGGSAGGSTNGGTVFKITPSSGTESVLYTFGQGGSLDPTMPEGGLLLDASTGNLYGTATNGGTQCGGGAVFKISSTGTETTLYSFSCSGVSDGQYPEGSLVTDSAGNLYGVTAGGGANSYGTVYKLTPSTGALSLLYSFPAASIPAGAVNPVHGLVMDTSGNLYGTTYWGGTDNAGTVFKINASSGTESTLYNFTGGADGGHPDCRLVIDANGNLYGTTLAGGTAGDGTVFEISPSGQETVLHAFAGGADGSAPSAGLVMDQSGNLYGTTEAGGANGIGTIFKLVP